MPEGRYEGLRQRHTADFEAMLPGYTERIDWPAAPVREERVGAWLSLLETALAR